MGRGDFFLLDTLPHSRKKNNDILYNIKNIFFYKPFKIINNFANKGNCFFKKQTTFFF